MSAPPQETGWADLTSGLYEGVVVHERLRPVRHSLRYRVFSLLLDMDELDELDRRSRLFARNRFALLSFHDRDHGCGPDAAGMDAAGNGDGNGDGGRRTARRWVDEQLRAAGLPTGGKVLALCFPRVLGYVFNPLTVWFCHAPDGTLGAVLYEVSNTFGQRHSYLLPATAGPDGLVRHGCGKRFYVSPFMDMDMTYDFVVAPPNPGADRDGAPLSVTIRQGDADGPTLTAALTVRRRILSDRALASAWLRRPLMTLKVTAGIYWEALHLWRKGLRLRPRPPAPAAPTTFTPFPAAPFPAAVAEPGLFAAVADPGLFAAVAKPGLFAAVAAAPNASIKEPSP